MDEQTKEVIEAARALLAAIDRTAFYDLGDAGETDPADNDLPDDVRLDGGDGWPNGPVTFADVRRLRKALEGLSNHRAG